MKRACLAFLCLLSLCPVAVSQTATDLNEGIRLILLGSNSYEFKWWARADVYYLVDVSDDLYSWNYIEEVFVGAGGVSSPVYFNVSGEKLFVRLNTDPFNTDVDGDGMSDGWEVLYGLGSRFNDSVADLDGDGITNLEEYLLETAPDSAGDTASAGLVGLAVFAP